MARMERNVVVQLGTEAFGQLLALAAYARCQEIGEPFVNCYLGCSPLAAPATHKRSARCSASTSATQASGISASTIMEVVRTACVAGFDLKHCRADHARAEGLGQVVIGGLERPAFVSS
jgi:hypothetical protein